MAPFPAWTTGKCFLSELFIDSLWILSILLEFRCDLLCKFSCRYARFAFFATYRIICLQLLCSDILILHLDHATTFAICHWTKKSGRYFSGKRFPPGKKESLTLLFPGRSKILFSPTVTKRGKSQQRKRIEANSFFFCIHSFDSIFRRKYRFGIRLDRSGMEFMLVQKLKIKCVHSPTTTRITLVSLTLKLMTLHIDSQLVSHSVISSLSTSSHLRSFTEIDESGI